MFKKTLPFIFLIVFVVIVFRPWWQNGKLPIPADAIVGMYHPWRDYYSTDYPNGVPFKNFQITDAVRQQYPWRQLAIELLFNGQMPNWNPYSFSGTPLLANLQSAPFYPLNLLYVFKDFAFIWSVQVLLQIILGGIFMVFFLKNLKLTTQAVVLGSLSWVGSGFFVAWLMWNTTVQTVIWLPLAMLAVDKLFGQKRVFWTLVLTVSLTSSFLAGYLQPFLYVFLTVSAYFLFRLWEHKQFKVLTHFLLALAIFVLLTFPQWGPTLKFIQLSARDIDQSNWNRPDWFLPWQNISQLIAPDYFGNPATLNYFGVWNYQEFVSYPGIVGLTFALLAIFSRVKERTTHFFVGLLLFAFIFVLPTPLGKLPFQLNIPFLSTSQPSRLILIVDFCLAILASFGLDGFLKAKQNGKYIVAAIITGALCLLWVIGVKMDLEISQRNLVVPSILAGISLIILFLAEKFKSRQRVLVFVLLTVCLFDLSRFFIKFEPFSGKNLLYPQTKITEFLVGKKEELYRVVALDDRIFPPNFFVNYKIQTVSGYDPLYLRRYGEFIAAAERGRPDISPPLGFNRIITPKNYQSPVFDFLGVKYLLSFEKLPGPQYTLIMEEGQTKLYENNQILPRAFFVGNVINVSSKNEAMKQLFAPGFSFKETAVVEGNLHQNYFQAGKVVITKYTENEVIFSTENQGQGFLVFSDVYYPDWQVEIDGTKSEILIANYTFRGVVIPAGKHKVRFYFQ